MSIAWSSVTDAQATIIAALLTVLAAVVGVVLGWFLFSTKVKDLGTALDASKVRLAEHEALVTGVLSELQEKMTGLDRQVAAILEKASRAESSRDEAQPVEPGQEGDRRSVVKEQWLQIRDRIEQIAADPSIDGRTRAKYGRIDRRNYGWLIDALEWDERLPNADLYREAMSLWHRFKSNRAQPNAADVQRMAQIIGALAPIAAAG